MLELTIWDSCNVVSDLFWNYYKIKNVRDLFIFKYQWFFPPHLILIHNMQECCLKWADINILFLAILVCHDLFLGLYTADDIDIQSELVTFAPIRKGEKCSILILRLVCGF